MKLYATVSSERATKGQGGNEFINIIITCRDGDTTIELADLYVHETTTDFELIDNQTCTVLKKVIKFEPNTKGVRLFHDEYIIRKQKMQDLKGEKQKGENYGGLRATDGEWDNV